MKLNNLLLSLALVATGSVMVACGSGSSGGSSNTMVVKQLALPQNFTLALGNNGIGYNAAAKQLAIPGSNGYATIQLSDKDAAEIATLGESVVMTISTDSSIIIAPTRPVKGDTVIVLIISKNSKNTTSSSTGNIVPQEDNEYDYFTFKLNDTPLNPCDSKPYLPVCRDYSSVYDAHFKVGPFMGYNPGPDPTLMSVNQSNNQVNIQASVGNTSPPISFSTPECDGTPITISFGENGGKSYIGVGTDAESNNVCVATLSSDTPQTVTSVTNLAKSAPVYSANKPNGYRGGIVDELSFSSVANTNKDKTLTGYWTVGTQIYKVLGSTADASPVGTGFLNITSDVSQRPNSYAQPVTFSNPPVLNANSMSGTNTLTDGEGNVWVGGSDTTNSQVYLLSNGGTAWKKVNLSSNEQSTYASLYKTAYTGDNAVIATVGGKTFSVQAQ